MNIYEQCLDEDMERWMGEWMDGWTDNGWKERRIGGWILTRFNGSHGLGHTLDYFLLSILSSFHLLDPRSDPEANFLSLFKITLFLLRHFHNPRGKLISKKKKKWSQKYNSLQVDSSFNTRLKNHIHGEKWLAELFTKVATKFVDKINYFKRKMDEGQGNK